MWVSDESEKISHLLRCLMATSFCCFTKGKVGIVDELRSTELEAMEPVGVCVFEHVNACVHGYVCACGMKLLLCILRDLLGQLLLKSV
jgi:hypothetical protein